MAFSALSLSTSVQERDILPDLHKNPLSSYAHGLDGVDQVGNYLWVNVLLICFIILLVSTLALRLTKMWYSHFRHLASMGATRPEQQNYWSLNQTTWWPKLNRHLFLAPLWRNRRNQPFQLSSAVTNGTLPGRFHVLLLVVYCLSNVAYCLALPWHEPQSESVVAALRGRSGTLSVLNLIPTILFALRNNPLIWILKVSYDDFNLLHRWAARITIIEAVVHTLAWASNTYRAGKWSEVGAVFVAEPSYTWGMVGTACFFVIFVQAWAPIRHSFYETFLNFHRWLVLFALIGIYVHLDTHKLPQLPWLQLVACFWGGEWLCRVVRIVYLNVSARAMTKVHVEALPGEACRVTFDMVRPWSPRPGCHVHMYLPRIALWSSHPFSVAWSPVNQRSSTASFNEKLPISEKELLSITAPPESNSITLICRARTGMTRKLYDKASACPSHSFTTTGFIEGPYGGQDSLASYGTVVLFAGGVGITHQVMYVRKLVEGYANSTVACKKLLLVWTIPDTECLEWIRTWMDEILRLERRKEVLRIMIFVTRPRRGMVQSASETVQMLPGRCDVQTIIDREIATRVGAMAVTVCGSGGFSDGVRKAVRNRVELGCVDFIEEAFTY